MPPWKTTLTDQQRGTSSTTCSRSTRSPSSATPTRATRRRRFYDEDPLPVTIDNIDAGKRIWTRECLVCHGDAATGEGIYRAGIEPVPPDFNSPGGLRPLHRRRLLLAHQRGRAWTAMPTWKVRTHRTSAGSSSSTSARCSRRPRLSRLSRRRVRSSGSQRSTSGGQYSGVGVLRARQGHLRQHVLAVSRDGG